MGNQNIHPQNASRNRPTRTRPQIKPKKREPANQQQFTNPENQPKVEITETEIVHEGETKGENIAYQKDVHQFGDPEGNLYTTYNRYS
jgi:hypothetical protein